MGGSVSASWRTLVVVCSLVALGVTGCAGGPGDAADGEPERSSSPSLEPGPPGPVTLTTGRPSGEPTSDIEGLPSEFPGSLEGMPDFAPRPGVPARALYRPSETRGDGSGWDSEEIALFRAGSWTRISLGSVGLEDGLWPGSEPMGTGELSPDGRLVSWDTDDGVAVLDLYRGSSRLLLSGTGPVTGTRWLPGSDLLLAQRPRGPDRLVSVGTGTSSASPVETRSATVLSSGDLGRLVPAGDGSRLVVFPADDDVRTRTSRVLDVPAGGPVVQGWGAGSMLALLPRVGRSRPGEMRVVDLDTGRPRGTLRWSGGVGTTLEVHGWVGEEAVLVSVDGALTAWDPSRRIVSRLATLPPSDGGGDRGAVGLSLAPALLTTP